MHWSFEKGIKLEREWHNILSTSKTKTSEFWLLNTEAQIARWVMSWECDNTELTTQTSTKVRRSCECRKLSEDWFSGKPKGMYPTTYPVSVFAHRIYSGWASIQRLQWSWSQVGPRHVCFKIKVFLMYSSLRIPVIFHSCPQLPQRLLLKAITGLMMIYSIISGNLAFCVTALDFQM